MPRSRPGPCAGSVRANSDTIHHYTIHECSVYTAVEQISCNVSVARNPLSERNHPLPLCIPGDLPFWATHRWQSRSCARLCDPLVRSDSHSAHAMADTALINSELPALKLVSRGKVRDVYATSSLEHLLFVATDRISAYDVILRNVRPIRLRMFTVPDLSRRVYPTRAKCSRRYHFSGSRS